MNDVFTIGYDFTLEALTASGVREPERGAAIIRKAAVEAARHLDARGQASCVVEPGDSTRYVFAMTLFGPAPSLAWGGGQLVVAMPGHGEVFTLDPKALHHPSYIAEKSNLHGSSVGVVAGFLTMLSAALP